MSCETTTITLHFSGLKTEDMTQHGAVRERGALLQSRSKVADFYCFPANNRVIHYPGCLVLLSWPPPLILDRAEFPLIEIVNQREPVLGIPAR